MATFRIGKIAHPGEVATITPNDGATVGDVATQAASEHWPDSQAPAWTLARADDWRRIDPNTSVDQLDPTIDYVVMAHTTVPPHPSNTA